MRLLAVYLSLGLVSTIAADVGLAVTEQPDAPAAVTAAPTVTVAADNTPHDLRAAQARANRDMRRRRLHAIRVRELAQARARAAAAARERAAAARAAAARPRVAGSSLAGGVPAIWQALARCESGGNWHDTAGQYEGGVQFLNSTWLSYGGGAYARHAYDATPLQQVTIARRVLNADGPSQWPVCGRASGSGAETRSEGGSYRSPAALRSRPTCS